MIKVTISSKQGQVLYESTFATFQDASTYIDGVMASDERASFVYLNLAAEDAFTYATAM